MSYLLSSVLFLLFQLGLGWPGPGPIHVSSGSTAPSVRAGVSCESGGTTCTTSALTVTAGDIVWMMVQSYEVGTNSASDSKSDSFSAANAHAVSNDSGQQTLVATSAAGGSTTFTCTTTSSTTTLTCVALDIAPGSASNALDKIAAGTGDSTSLSSGATSTTSMAAELLIGCGSGEGTGLTFTAGSSWTIPSGATTNAGGTSSMCEYQVVSATGTYTATATISSSEYWIMQIGTLE